MKGTAVNGTVPPAPHEIAPMVRRILEEFERDGVEMLRREGITGKRSVPTSCPLARLLRRHTGLVWTVGSSLTSAPLHALLLFPLGTRARQFVLEFDNGGHPEFLEIPPAASPNGAT